MVLSLLACVVVVVFLGWIALALLLSLFFTEVVAGLVVYLTVRLAGAWAIVLATPLVLGAAWVLGKPIFVDGPSGVVHGANFLVGWIYTFVFACHLVKQFGTLSYLLALWDANVG